jgi:hypothetical protein
LGNIAGEKLDDVSRVIGTINSEKEMEKMDVLGENITTRDEFLAAVRE